MYFVQACVAILWLELTVAIAEKIVPSPVERPLTIGSFNIQNLGQSKSKNETVMAVIRKILLRYDLVLIQEIVTTDETMMTDLVEQLNKNMNSSSQYLMTISERLGRGTAKEQYAFLYRSDKLKFSGGHTFPDVQDDFMRPPYISHFTSPTVRGLKSFLAIGIHTQPKNAANETSALAQVYDYASQHFKVKDAIIMGDMNAGCANVRIGDWEFIDLWTRPEFTWLIKHAVDTTVSVNCCPYDRFVIAGENLEEAVIWNSIGTFNFQDVYGISTPMALAVSDHWPIEFKLKGTVSDVVQENVKSTLCLSVKDKRKNSLPPALDKQKTTMGFKIYSDEHFVLLEKSSSSLPDLMLSLEALKKRYPDLLSTESLSAVSYKTSASALSDMSSHQEVMNPQFLVQVEFYRENETTEIAVCTETPIN